MRKLKLPPTPQTQSLLTFCCIFLQCLFEFFFFKIGTVSLGLLLSVFYLGLPILGLFLGIVMYNYLAHPPYCDNMGYY